jgi:hypothetical protein
VEDDAKLRLDLRLVPADDRPADPVVLDDIVRLIRQAVVTAPEEAPKVTEPAEGFRQPSADENRDLRSLESRIKNRIEQASAESQAVIEKRAETAKQPDGEPRLKDEALRAAEQVVSAVQRAILRGVAVRVPETET